MAEKRQVSEWAARPKGTAIQPGCSGSDNDGGIAPHLRLDSLPVPAEPIRRDDSPLVDYKPGGSKTSRIAAACDLMHGAMENLSPHRSFVEPGSAKGIPGVHKSTPIPRRAIPLAGTKSMLCPHDMRVKKLVTHHHTLVIENTPAAQFLGILALISSIVLVALFLWSMIDKTNGWFWSPFVVITGLAVNHLLSIFSLVLSSGRNLAGGLAIPLTYVGGLLVLVVGHFLGY